MADVLALNPQRLCVLKFGSSVLEREEDYRAAAQEVYRHVRLGEKIIAVVSALAGETDALFAQAERVGGDGPDGLVARLARVGELRSAALMALALTRIGVRACAMDPDEMGLLAEGAPLDSNLSALDREAMESMLATHDVVVVPGFTAKHEAHGVVTLGRGGTDLSAVFFAARLGAKRVRLLKDVDGVYAEDPAKNPAAERYGVLDYDAAAKASAGLIQPKAIEAAKAEGIAIEVAAVGRQEATVVAALPSAKAVPVKPRRLRVAMLGHGVVGAGVLEMLKAAPDWFEVNPVLVRDPSRHEGHRFTDDPDEALAGNPDIVVELMGGTDAAPTLSAIALSRGAHLVTANKASLARHPDLLFGQGVVRCSAAVGGGAPVLETVERLAPSGLRSVEGVMNGTSNFILCRMAEGWSLDDAVARAQALGFAEADPSADVDGLDAADKLVLIARAAFGVALDPAAIARQSLRELPASALANGVVKQVGRCWKEEDGTVRAEVRLEALPASHPLAGARDEENRFLLRGQDGKVHEVHGKGAGRWPTAASVFADIMDVQRDLAVQPASAQPMRMSA